MDTKRTVINDDLVLRHIMANKFDSQSKSTYSGSLEFNQLSNEIFEIMKKCEICSYHRSKLKTIQTWTKWPTHNLLTKVSNVFLGWPFLYFDTNFTSVCFLWGWRTVVIGLPTQQGVTWLHWNTTLKLNIYSTSRILCWGVNCPSFCFGHAIRWSIHLYPPGLLQCAVTINRLK